MCRPRRSCRRRRRFGRGGRRRARGRLRRRQPKRACGRARSPAAAAKVGCARRRRSPPALDPAAGAPPAHRARRRGRRRRLPERHGRGPRASYRRCMPKNTPDAAASLCGVRSPEKYGRKTSRPAAARPAASISASSAASPAAPVAFATQVSDAAAERITYIRCHVAGRQWQNACTVRSGSGRKPPSETKITPDVPSETKPDRARHSRCRPRRRRCRPPRRRRRCPASGQTPRQHRQQFSGRLPALDQRRHLRPATARAPSSSRPATSADVEPQRAGCVGHVGNRLAGRVSGAASPSAAARCAVAGMSPARGAAPRASFGAVKPGIARLPAICCGARALISSAHSATERPSFHKMAGRSTRSAASSSTAPASALTARCRDGAPDRPVARRSCSAASVARHQSAGFCSPHNGCGRETSSDAAACATTSPASPETTTLTPEVPRSMPRWRTLRAP